MFVENFRKFMKYYGAGRKLKLFGLFMLSLVSGFIEFTGIALIYPFILLIINPNSVVHSKYYIAFSNFFREDSVLTNAFILGFFVAILFVLKNLFMIFSLYLQNKFVNNWKFAINRSFMNYYLFSPYKNSLSSSPSEKIYNLTFLTSQSIDGFICRIINLVTNAVIVLMILGFLVTKFPWAAVVTGSFVVISMVFHNRFFREKAREISRILLRTSSQSSKKTLEIVSNLKEIKILSAEDYFYYDYLATQWTYNKVLFDSSFYSSIPPYIIEIFVVLSLLLLAAIISVQNVNNTSWMVASYAVVVAAIFRVAPALNRIQSSISAINTTRDTVRTIISEYEKSDFNFAEEHSDLKIGMNYFIRLQNVSFAYKKEPVIKDLNLEIKKGEFVGIIGASGAGKSTLADIIMGLLPVDKGEIYLDNLELVQNNFCALRRLVGYVPQQINILDGSFKRNIAWGVKEDEIDDNQVIEALKKAQLYDFVSKFEDGIDSDAIVGSMGLSQGQKQRVAIARALYRNPSILILDEATSSLDVETEHEITQMLCGYKGEKTIIAIAHRLSTLKSCDKLIYLKDGRIVDTGSFEELSNKHADFERLIRLSSLGIN